MSLDRDEIQRRLYWKLFGSPVTLLPILGGATVMIAPFLLNMDAAVPLFLGLTSVGAGLASLLIRGSVGRDRISRQIVEEHESEVARGQTIQLDALEKRLERDGDPRTEALLSDLRQLVDAVKNDSDWRGKVNVVAAADMVGGIDTLFNACVKSLERTLELHRMAEGIQTAAAKQGLLEEREHLVADVENSIAQLSTLITELRVLGTRADAQKSDLSQIRAQLDVSLAAARKTVDQTNEWGEESNTEQALKRLRAMKEKQ